MATKEETLPLPPFTVKKLQDSIPKHCFERPLVTSFAHTLWDISLAAGLFYLASYINILPIPSSARVLLWCFYWICQGVVLTGLWVIGHECGHRAFSSSTAVNDAVGLVLHTMLLVPYHSWRISHGRHHKNTGHAEKDEVFVPSRRSEVSAESTNDTSIGIVFQITIMLLFGWPAYLFANAAGRKYDRPANHFSPWSPIFAPHQRVEVILSDVALLVWVSVLGLIAWTTSFQTLLMYYFVPYLFVNMWLVLITNLHHTDKNIPHFSGEEWTWLRGALCTVDRDYGFLLNFFLHNITDTHVCHHLFPTIPHYHAVEATEALKKVLGSYYHSDETPILEALFASFKQCVFIEDEGKVLYYQDRSKLKTQ